MRAALASPEQHWHSNPVWVRLRKSPCPPVWLIGIPEMKTRGPSNRPLSMAAFIP